jgi:hypothetical protein
VKRPIVFGSLASRVLSYCEIIAVADAELLDVGAVESVDGIVSEI